MTKEQATQLLNIYGKAWVGRDPELILTIFTSDATYDDSNEPEVRGHEGIRAYWLDKVVGGQKNIVFKLLNIWVDGGVVVAEWDARFTDTKRDLLIEMREVGIFAVKDGKFGSLREYYRTKKTPL